jgi:chemotaxis protein MotB
MPERRGMERVQKSSTNMSMNECAQPAIPNTRMYNTMKKSRPLIVLAVFLITIGCVSTTKYKERLADIDNLKKDISSLKESLKQKETELAKLNKDYTDMEKQKQALAEDNANLNEILKAKKDELNKKIAELRAKLSMREVDIFSLQKRMDEITQEKARSLAEMEKSLAEINKTHDNLMAEMQNEIKAGEITITQLRDKLTLSMVEKILFDSGSAEIKPNGKKILDRVAAVLKQVTDRQIRIEGHTDNVPIGSKIVDKFPTNWELSTARATTVTRYLQDEGVDAQLLSACGYAENRPVASNDTEEGRAKNRRIEIVLIPKDFVRISAEEKIP